MNDRLSETGRSYGMEINVGNANVMRISREPSPLQVVINQKKLENVKYSNYLCSITNDGKCTHEVNSRIAMAKADFTRKKELFTRKL
jgi:hypothetical protein